MNRELKMMLLGVFLAAVSIWCLLFGQNSAFFGWTSIILILAAIISFTSGFAPNPPGEKDPPDYPNDEKENNP